jgi:hypothetical protein
MSVNAVPFYLSPAGVSVMLDHRAYSIGADQPTYTAIISALKTNDSVALRDAIDVHESLKKWSNGGIEIRGDAVFFRGVEVHNVMVDKLLHMKFEGFHMEPWEKFLGRLLTNPSQVAINELYLFLESGHLPITEDGHFLAYKAVNADYRDYHSNSFDNSIGQKHSMERSVVDPNRHNHCSRGFHFCSLEYGKHFLREGGHMMVVKIDPADVVSIPSDYNNTKGRTWRYEVVDEVSYEAIGSVPDYTLAPVVISEDEREVYEPEEDEEWDGASSDDWADEGDDVEEVTVTISVTNTMPKRDAKGRFIPRPKS